MSEHAPQSGEGARIKDGVGPTTATSDAELVTTPGVSAGTSPGAAGGATASPTPSLLRADGSEQPRMIGGRYELRRKLGEGAMGAVYLGWHTMMEHAVAIKLLHPEMSRKDKILRRFKKEAQAAARIKHPNICAATDFGEASDGSLFLVMEYLEGAALKDRIEAQAPFEPARAVGIAVQVASALDRAQSLGIVHRDLKPDNIFLVSHEGFEDFVKILDFGIARVYLGDEKESTQLTQAGEVFGTPQYMAPEQAEGGEIDHRADLYALGVIVYEMLTGKRPFEADTPMQLLWKHVMDPPPAFSEVAPGLLIPADVERVVMKLLAKKPAERYGSAAELLGDLQQLESFDPQALSGGPLFSLSSLAPGRASSLNPAVNPELTTTAGGGGAQTPAGGQGAAAGRGAAALGQRASTFALAAARGTARAGRGAYARFRALPARKQKLSMGVVGGAILLLTLLSVLFGGDSPEEEAAAQAAEEARAVDPVATVREEAEPVKDPVAGSLEALLNDVRVIDAMTQLESGSGESRAAGLSALQSLAPELGEQPGYLAIMGKAHARGGKDTDAVAAYERLFAAHEGAERNPFVVEMMTVLATRKSDALAQPARALAIAHMSPELAASLVHSVMRPKEELRARLRVREILNESGVMSDLEPWAQTVVALRTIESWKCDEQKPYVEQLAAMGNVRGALPALRSIKTEGEGACSSGLFSGRHDCYKCMKELLEGTINRLQAPPD